MAWGNHKAKKFVDEYGNDMVTGVTSVYFQPIDQAYPTGRIAMTKCIDNSSIWVFTSDVLADDMHYDIYASGTFGSNVNINDRQFAPNSIPNIG